MQVEAGLRPWSERLSLQLWGWGARHPRLYGLGTAIAARLLKLLGGQEGLIHRLPLGASWTDGKDFPAPAGKTFRELYQAKKESR